MEILTGFLREYSKRPKIGDAEAFPLPTDTQAALSVVAQLQLEYDAPRPLDFGGTDLRHGNFHKTKLQGASFTNANLSYADLREADLRGASLGNVSATSTQFKGANLSGAHLIAADLEWAQLDGVNLQQASLFAASLYETTNLAQADLRGADFSYVDLKGIDLSEAIYDETTVWPDGFEPNAPGEGTGHEG